MQFHHFLQILTWQNKFHVKFNSLHWLLEVQISIKVLIWKKHMRNWKLDKNNLMSHGTIFFNLWKIIMCLKHRLRNWRKSSTQSKGILSIVDFRTVICLFGHLFFSNFIYKNLNTNILIINSMQKKSFEFK